MCDSESRKIGTVIELLETQKRAMLYRGHRNIGLVERARADNKVLSNQQENMRKNKNASDYEPWYASTQGLDTGERFRTIRRLAVRLIACHL